MSIPGSPTSPITIAGRDNKPYVRNISAWLSGIPGLIIHHIPEEPQTYTTTHKISGLRIGGSRFPSIKSACDSCIKCFGGFNFNREIKEIMIDIKFTLCLEVFCRECRQVPRNMNNVKKIDLAEQIEREGIASVIKAINRTRNKR